MRRHVLLPSTKLCTKKHANFDSNAAREIAEKLAHCAKMGREVMIMR